MCDLLTSSLTVPLWGTSLICGPKPQTLYYKTRWPLATIIASIWSWWSHHHVGRSHKEEQQQHSFTAPSFFISFMLGFFTFVSWSYSFMYRSSNMLLNAWGVDHLVQCFTLVEINICILRTLSNILANSISPIGHVCHQTPKSKLVGTLDPFSLQSNPFWCLMTTLTKQANNRYQMKINTIYLLGCNARVGSYDDTRYQMERT